MIQFLLNVSDDGVLSTRNRSSFPNGACGTCGGDEGFVQASGGET